MQAKFKDLGARLISGLLMAMIGAIPIIFGSYWFLAAVVLITIRILYEWVRMADKQGDIWPYIIPMSGAVLAIILMAINDIGSALIVVAITAIICGLERRWRRDDGQLLWSGLGAIYIILPSMAMIGVRTMEAGPDNAGFMRFLFILLVVIGADVGAYFGGSAIGGPKIAPNLSPKKTWSGFLSGLLLGTALGVACSFFVDLTVMKAIVMAVPIVIFSVIGDFFESGLKRKLDVKDTGGVLPGHGGVLDRIDSLMFAMCFFAIALWIWPTLWPS